MGENINIEIIQTMLKDNNGVITTKQVTKNGIHRMYLKIMVEKGFVEKISNGIYIDSRNFNDVYYSFQLRYPKTIFARMTALYFYGLTEVYPNSFDLTTRNNYHVDDINKNHLVMKCNDEIIEIGITKVKTPMGNLINAYDPERCICDIIKFRHKLDLEQVKKSVKMYLNSQYRNLDKLIDYSKKLKIYNDVMEFVGMYYE